MSGGHIKGKGYTEEEKDCLTNGTNAANVSRTDKRVSILCSTRWRLSVLIFLTFINVFLHRINFSIAVVCMVDLGTDDTDLHVYTVNTSAGVQQAGNDTFMEIQSIQRKAVSCARFGSRKNQTVTPELRWDKSATSVLLSSYFYGSFFTQVPAGRMADRFGGKHIITVCLIVSGVCSLLMPVCARTHIALVFVLRICIGFAGGAIIPAAISMIQVWTPIKERSSTFSLCSSGHFVGTIITFLTSGLLCVYGFDNGWPSIFYVYGAFTLLFVQLWIYEVYNSPYQHPRISEAELDYITSCTHRVKNTVSKEVPWRRLLISKPVWASIIAHSVYNWVFYTILINLPLFLKEVLQFDIQENGFYSSLPYVFCMISTMGSGKLAEVLIHNGVFAALGARKALTAISFIGSAVSVIGSGHVTCETRHIAVICLCAACLFKGFAFGGFLANHVEYGGQFAGTLYGLSNAAGVITALLSSMTAGLLTPNGLQEEWQLVFYVAAALNIAGLLAFLAWSSSDLQPWARGEPVEITVNVNHASDVDKLNQDKERVISQEDTKH